MPVDTYPIASLARALVEAANLARRYGCESFGFTRMTGPHGLSRLEGNYYPPVAALRLFWPEGMQEPSGEFAQSLPRNDDYALDSAGRERRAYCKSHGTRPAVEAWTRKWNASPRPAPGFLATVENAGLLDRRIPASASVSDLRTLAVASCSAAPVAARSPSRRPG